MDEQNETNDKKQNNDKKIGNKTQHTYDNKEIDRSEIIGLSKKYNKIHLNKPNKCYFSDSSGILVEHHMSYIPEEVLYVSPSNHRKIHFIFRKYHELIIKKDQEITQLLRENIILKEVGKEKELIIKEELFEKAVLDSEDNVYSILIEILKEGIYDKAEVILNLSSRTGYSKQHLRKKVNLYIRTKLIIRRGRFIFKYDD